MELSIQEIRHVLNKILEDSLSREDASLWAFRLRKMADENTLLYLPEGNEMVIWESILFIEGIDLQIEPNVYLHSRQDIQDFYDRIVHIR